MWKLLQCFADFPLVIEVRHSSWIADDVLNMLAERGVGIANIDQPLFHRSVKPAVHVQRRSLTSGYTPQLSAVVFKTSECPRALRLSFQELEPWADRIRMLSEDATETYAVGNNHNLSKAVTNGLEIKAPLEQPVRVPKRLSGAIRC